MNIGAVMKLLLTSRQRKRSTAVEVENNWLKQIILRSIILGSFTLLFLYFRVKLNKTPPIFSGINKL